MRNFLRNPLTWLVVAEFVIVGALIVLAWNAIASSVHPALAMPAPQQPDTAGDPSSTDLPELPSVSKPISSAKLPGLNLDSDFWRARLSRLNQDQVVFEQLEWRIVHGAVSAVERYLQTVVIPSIQGAESGRS